MNKSVSVFTAVIFMLTNVLQSNARRGVARPHTESHSQAGDEVIRRPAAYYFSQKVTEPCGIARELCGNVTKEEVVNMADIAREKVDEAMRELSNVHCEGMTLTSLPPLSKLSNMTYTEKVSYMHLSLSSILANLFFMKMDWIITRGLPCAGFRQMVRIGRQHTRLVNSWQSLTCLYLRSVPPEQVSTMSPVLQSNLARVLNTPVSRYTSCEMRRTRDCVLLSQAGAVLGRLETFYQDSL